MEQKGYRQPERGEACRTRFWGDPYRFRCGPVPRTGRYPGGYRRRVRHWFRRYRQDRIPEYRPYIREKAMLTEFYDDEVWHAGPYRSWKDNSKKRHQWE